MRFQRVLLVQPPYQQMRYGAYRAPAGLGYLSEILKANQIEHDVLDMDLGYTYEDLAERVREFKPDLVGVTMLTLGYMHTFSLMDRLKADFPDVKLIIGGAHASVSREASFKDCPSLDFACYREGEETLVELCGDKPIEEILALYWRDENGEIQFNGERPWHKALDDFHFPRYEKFELDKYILKEIPLVTSRGCPYKCIFCPVHLAIGRKMRWRSTEGVGNEIEFWADQGFGFYVADDNFTAKKQRVYELCDEIESRNLVGKVRINCGNGIRADRCDLDMLARMYEVGFNALAFGVEGGNDKILKIIKKGEKAHHIDTAIKNATEIGFDVTLFFIVGTPGETLEDVDDSIELAERHPVMDVRFYNLIPFPHTELFDWVRDNERFLVEPDQYLTNTSAWDIRPVFDTPEFPAEQRIQALGKCYEARRRIRERHMKLRLAKLGPLAGVGAKIFVNDRVQLILQNSRIIRQAAEAVYHAYGKLATPKKSRAAASTERLAGKLDIPAGGNFTPRQNPAEANADGFTPLPFPVVSGSANEAAKPIEKSA